MARVLTTRDAFARNAGPAAGLGALGRDRFRELAERRAAKKRVSDVDASAVESARPRSVPPPEAANEPPPERAVSSRRTLANGAALEVIATRSVPAVTGAEKQGEIVRERLAAKTSTLVLVSGESASAALPEPAVHAGGGQAALVMPARSTPKAKPKRGSGGGGGKGSGGAGAGQPPRDRLFNQDDLMAALIVLAVLLLLALYFFRGGGGAPADDRLLNTQSVATEPVSEPVAPPPDPFGDRAVDLTPKSLLPVESVAVAAAPPPPKPIEIKFQTYFCTASSQLTSTAKAALEKQVADWSQAIAGSELIVAGYADTRGSTEYNRALGNARASTVAEFLRSRNLTVVELTGVGELEGLADDENCPNQRRVDIRTASAAAEPPTRSCVPPQGVADLACG